MKIRILLTITSSCLVSAVAADQEQKKPVYRDAVTHGQLVKKLKAGQNRNPMKKLIPSEGEDPSVKNRPKDIISSSDVISSSGVTTLVPKKSIMRIPESYADRINNHTPGNRIVGWLEFFTLNRGWITQVDVSRAQAEGKIPIADEVVENLSKNRKLIIATISSNPISLLEPKQKEEAKQPTLAQ